MKSPLTLSFVFASILGASPGVVAQVPGTYTPYGTSCASQGKSPPTFTAVQLPVVGGEFITTLGNLLPNHCSMLVVGLSNQSSHGTPLPASLAMQGAPGCMLQASTEYCWMFDNQQGSVTLRLLVPPLRPLVGYPIYMQILAPDIGNNAANIAVSTGAKFVIGG